MSVGWRGNAPLAPSVLCAGVELVVAVFGGAILFMQDTHKLTFCHVYVLPPSQASKSSGSKCKVTPMYLFLFERAVIMTREVASTYKFCDVLELSSSAVIKVRFILI